MQILDCRKEMFEREWYLCHKINFLWKSLPFENEQSLTKFFDINKSGVSFADMGTRKAWHAKEIIGPLIWRLWHRKICKVTCFLLKMIYCCYFWGSESYPIFLQKYSKKAKVSIFVQIDKWSTSIFQKSISDQNPVTPPSKRPPDAIIVLAYTLIWFEFWEGEGITVDLAM